MCESALFRLHRRSKGFVLFTAALTIIMLIGILGLTQDLARMYVVRNELQAFVDAASMGAAMLLDGTDQGLDHARQLVSSYQDLDRLNFQTTRPEDVTVSFSTTAAGPYLVSPPTAIGMRYVQVTARGSVVLYFMPGFSATAPAGMLLLAIARSQTLQAAATSGQVLVNKFYENLLPYSPDAIQPADDNFGYKKGKLYTLRWPPKGQRPDPDNPPPPNSKKWKNWCQGDREVNFVTPSGSQDRGFIDIGEGGGSGGAAYIRQAIISNVQSHPLAIGDSIDNVPGNKGTESDAMRERYEQDTDTESANYTEYAAKLNDPYATVKGNGRRLVIVPVNNPTNDKVVGFGLFYLHYDVCGDDNTSSCCAEYVGSGVVPGRPAAAQNAGAYKVRLLK